jgi:peptide deformylase
VKYIKVDNKTAEMIKYAANVTLTGQIAIANEIYQICQVVGVDYNKVKETILLEEGCLSYPHVFLNVKRPRKIKVRYQEPNGEPQTKVLDGMTARCFMHELDHLNGTTFLQKANRIHVERAMRKKKFLDRMVKNSEERGLV